MKNFIRDGNVIPVIAGTGGVSSGDVVVAGNLIGIAAYDAIEGAEVEIALTGVYSLPKDGSTIDYGAPLHWVAASGHVSATGGAGRWPIGNAVKSAGGSDDEVACRLPGIGIVEGT
jgi:predicted RecA/RadA family phage recombinase